MSTPLRYRLLALYVSLMCRTFGHAWETHIFVFASWRECRRCGKQAER